MSEDTKKVHHEGHEADTKGAKTEGRRPRGRTATAVTTETQRSQRGGERKAKDGGRRLVTLDTLYSNVSSVERGRAGDDTEITERRRAESDGRVDGGW